MKRSIPTIFPVAGITLAILSVPAVAQTPQAIAPYQLSVFANAPAGLSAPDSVAILGTHIFVGYGDNHAPDGSDGLSSQVVEYDMEGNALQTYTVLGHNDGLKTNPWTQQLWALQNEDQNPNLVIINPDTHEQKMYTFGPTPHGGGYDDLVFRDCKVYISASNPANNPNTGPAIVSAHLNGYKVEVESALAGEAEAIDIPTGATVKLNLQDPDSLSFDTLGNLVLDSQGDQELIIVSNPGANQRVLRLPLTYQSPSGIASVEVDDTKFAKSTEGFILFADKGLNQVFKLSKDAFAPGVAYTAADGASMVGTLDLSTGFISPIVTGLSAPGGLLFVDTSKNADNDRNASTCPAGI
jgi:hypothetical protein